MASNEINVDLEKRINQKNNGSMMKKFWTILVTLLVLLIPIAFLNGIIRDREDYRAEAVKSIALSWGKAQTLGSPVMYFEAKDGSRIANKYLQLNNYSADVKIQTEVRKKGIFKVPVYTADVLLKGDFKNQYSGSFDGKNVVTEFYVEDSIGFIDEPVFSIGNSHLLKSGNTKIVTNINSADKLIPFEISYKIRGLNDLYIEVNGDSNKISVAGDWDSPSFVGNFLPANRTIEKNLFDAQWTIPRIATSSLKNPKVGVSLLMPVDNYRMAERTLKYAFLFLSLTFLSYFIFEIVSSEQRKIHPLQYCMLGAAMQIFYLLLVSISEFINFGAAYFISAFMVISLIGIYTYFVITRAKSKLFSYLIVLLMGLLYAFLYVLLLQQDFALMLGSFGLFLIIAVIMYVTRNIDWYNDAG